jgi:hypothetical protein
MDASAFLPKIPVWVYRLLAAFPPTGMVGMDHFAIGSKETGMAKALINMLTLGSWYFFDVIQSFDSEKIAEEGLAIPFYGDAGIGRGKFGEGLLGGNDPSTKFWLNILFIFAGFTIAAVAGIFMSKPDPTGSIAKAIGGVSGAIAASIAGATVYSQFKSFAPTNLGSMGNLVSGLVLKGGGADEAPSGPSFVEILTLGTLATLTVTGFVLHSVRNST